MTRDTHERRSGDSAAGADQTIFHGSGEHVAVSVTGEKICCMCGANVAGKTRFKDAEGRYWCYDCGTADNERRKSGTGVPCPECGRHFAPSDLVEFEDVKLCQACAAKRRQQRKREQARIAAVAEEERRIEARRKQLLILGGIAAVIVLIVLIQFLI